MCLIISRRPQKQLDYVLEYMLDDVMLLNISAEERARLQAAHDQLRMDVSRFREQIAAAHNPEASSGKSLRILLL